MSWHEYLRWHVVNSIADDYESINSFHEEMCQRTLAAKSVAPTVEEVLDILAELVDAGNAKAVRMTSQGPVKVEGCHGPDELCQLWFTLTPKGRRENTLEEPPEFTPDSELLARPAAPVCTPSREPDWAFVRAAMAEALTGEHKTFEALYMETCVRCLAEKGFVVTRPALWDALARRLNAGSVYAYRKTERGYERTESWVSGDQLSDFWFLGSGGTDAGRCAAE